MRIESRWGKPLPEPEPRRPSWGPWTSHDTDEGEWVVDIPNDGEVTVTRLSFGDMETNTGRDISNADLVAAAPDLLAALRAHMDAPFQHQRDRGVVYIDRGSWDVLAATIDAAIAKATEGRS